MAHGQVRHIWPGGEGGGLNLELCGRQILENTTVRYPGTHMLSNDHLHLLKCSTAKIEVNRMEIKQPPLRFLG